MRDYPNMVYFVDIAAALGDTANGPYMSDGVHPNTAGYSIIACKWYESLPWVRKEEQP
jgi:lysophospholipase L1-like esterase